MDYYIFSIKTAKKDPFFFFQLKDPFYWKFPIKKNGNKFMIFSKFMDKKVKKMIIQ